MKKVISLSSLVLFSLFIIMESCSKSNSSPNTTTTINPASLVVSGTWAISSIIQRTEDKTSDYTGYVFTFMNEGSMKAEKNGAITNGTWSYTPSAVVYYGSTPSKASLTINLGSAKPFGQLSRIWNIDSVNTTSSRLALISPEVAEGMRLNFAKQ